MGRNSKKPRKNKLDPKQVHAAKDPKAKKEKDWGFEEILRSKIHRY